MAYRKNLLISSIIVSVSLMIAGCASTLKTEQLERENAELMEIIQKKDEQLNAKEGEIKKKEQENARLRDKLKGFGVFD